MWWSRALLVLALAALGPAACGFQPLYGRGPADGGSGVTADLSQVRVLGISDRLGQQVRNALVEGMSPRGEPANPRYVLSVRLTDSLSGLAYRKDDNATVGQISVQATYTLSHADGTPAHNGSAYSIATFNFLGPRYGSVAAERDARERAAMEVAAEIQRQVAVYLGTTARASAPPAAR